MCNIFATMWDNLCSKMTKDNKGQQQCDTLQPFAMSYAILQYSTVLPSTSATICDDLRSRMTKDDKKATLCNHL